MWTRFYRPILRFLWNALKTLGGWFGWLWDKAIKPAWNAIQRGVQIMWNRYYKPILKTLWNALKTLGGWFKWLWEKGVKPAWEKITNALRDGWKFIRERVFNPLIDFLRKDVPDAFERAKNRIKDIWDKVKSIASKPVEFIVKTVYNNGIRKVVNALPGVDNLNPINFRGAARGTSNVLPGYTPGRDVHRFVSPTAGGLELSGGEAVMRPEWTRMVGPRVVDAFNGAARHGRAALERVWASVTSGNTRMALGGILGRGPTRSSATGGEARRSFALGGVIGDLGDLIGNVRDGLVGAASGLGKRVSGWADTLGDRFGPWGSMMGKVVRNVGGQVREWLADKLRSMFRASGAAAGAGTPNGNGGLGPAAIAAANFVRSHFGFRGTIGGYSYRNIAGTNTLSKHALGKAIDIMQSVSPLAQSMYNYFSGPGYARFGVDNVIYNRRIFNASGGHHYYGGVSPHTDHVHVDFYDEGGPLYPGSTFAQNRTGKVETVFTNDNMVEMSRHLAQVATTLTTTDARQQQNAPLVENLTLQARPDEMPGLLSDANWELSRMRRGGVHAQRA
jgi:hypothetical protein